MITLLQVARARWWAVLLVFLAVAGCGVWPLGRPTASPIPLPGDRLVFMVQGGSGGFTHYFHAALITPALVVYGDGRVIQHDGQQALGVPAGYLISRVDPQLVATFVADAEARDLINDQTDFGTPQVTDMPSTTVHLHGASGPHEIYVYAFGEGFDDDLPRGQRRAREELVEVIERAYALSADGERSPYRPYRVRVTEFSEGSRSRGPTWPGPDPESFLEPVPSGSIRLACGELTGQAAEKAYDAARDNPDGIWIVGSKQRVFAVAPVLPGMEGCTD